MVGQIRPNSGQQSDKVGQLLAKIDPKSTSDQPRLDRTSTPDPRRRRSSQERPQTGAGGREGPRSAADPPWERQRIASGQILLTAQCPHRCAGPALTAALVGRLADHEHRGESMGVPRDGLRSILGLDLRPTHGRCGPISAVGLGSVCGRAWVDLGSIWGGAGAGTAPPQIDPRTAAERPQTATP